MPFFRKKPVVIEAVQHKHTANVPAWLTDAFYRGVVYELDGETYIKTLEGDHCVSNGDWIIKGVKGELYACKPDIFELTYEPA